MSKATEPADRKAQAFAAVLDALYLALPYVEDAEHDPAYKYDHVRKLTRQIRAALAQAEEASKGAA